MLADSNSPCNDTIASHSLFSAIAPSSALQISVIVPVRDEADQLIQTLDALRRQVDADEQPIRPGCYEVLLLANNCTDGSYELAERYQLRHPTFPLRTAQIQLPPRQANIGTARRLLMDAACDRLLSVGRPNGIIASTDGDTVVDSQWLYHIMTEVTNGCDAVAGRILAQDGNGPARLFHLRDVTYRQLIAQAESLLDPSTHDPWPRHFQHFGASLAVTCRAYLRAGRLPDVPHLEDEALYRALLRTDAKVRKSPQVKVFTSTRLRGRVAVGFSEQLRYWTQMHDDQRVQLAEPPNALVIKFCNRHRLRLLWQQRHTVVLTPALTTVARELGISADWLRQQLPVCEYFGQLWEKVEVRIAHEHGPDRWPPVPITEAIQELRAYLRSLTSATPSRTDPDGTARPVALTGDAEAAPQRPVPEMTRAPDRRSTGNPARPVSSAPAAGVHLAADVRV